MYFKQAYYTMQHAQHALSYVFAQHLFAAYTLHNRAGTLASLLYKAEKLSVRLSVRPTV